MSFQFIKYVLTHIVAVVTLESILALYFDKWSCSSSFMDAVAHPIARILEFLQSIMMRELHRRNKGAGSDRQSNYHIYRRSMSSPRKTTVNYRSHLSHKEGRGSLSRLKTDTEKGWRGRSPNRNIPDGINRKHRMNIHEAFQLLEDDDRHMSDTSSTNAESSVKEGHDRRW